VRAKGMLRAGLGVFSCFFLLQLVLSSRLLPCRLGLESGESLPAWQSAVPQPSASSS